MSSPIPNAPAALQLPPRNPINGAFELTVRCSLSCRMCMLRHDDAENPQLMAEELTAAQWIDMARQAAEAGTMALLITGGEPMLRPDFCEIWEGIYQFGFLMELYTNATLVTPKVMETLRKYPPHKIGVTLYGASPETYQRLCGNGTAFQRTLDGIRQLKTLPSELELRTTLVQDNFADAHAIDLLAEEAFGIAYGGVKQTSPVNREVRGACARVAECRVPPWEDYHMKAERRVEAVRRRIGPSFDRRFLSITETTSDVIPTTKPRATFFGCEAGMSQYTITYNGRLLACQMIGVFSTNALRDGLQAAWDQFPSRVRMPEPDGRCADCQHADHCPSCYASRHAETGSFYGCSDYIRESAKAKQAYASLNGGVYHEKR